MSRAAPALAKAIHARLAGDAALARLVDPARLLDRAPGAASAPAIVYGPVSSEDYSTATEPGELHLLTFEVRTGAEGQAGALAIAARLRALLHDQPLALREPGLSLVSLLHLSTRSRRQPRLRALAVEVAFRAVTEG